MNAKALSDCGMLDRFTRFGNEPLEHGITGVDEGPAGTGCIVAAGSNPPEYAPGRQQWVEGEKCWLAIESLPPRPGDLEREVGIEGHDVLLGDGAMWRVPLIRRWDEQRLEHVSNLPKKLTPKFDNGQCRYESIVRPEFAAVDAIAVRVFESFVAERTVSIDELFRDAVAMLSVNYRIGIEEAGLLGLLDEATALRILGLAIDLPRMQACAAKLSTQGVVAVDPVIEPE